MMYAFDPTADLILRNMERRREGLEPIPGPSGWFYVGFMGIYCALLWIAAISS